METPFQYAITVQWSPKHQKYEAFVPTLMSCAVRFLPECPIVGYGFTQAEAIQSIMWQSQLLINGLKKLAILPPPADIKAVLETSTPRLRSQHGSS